MTGPDQHRLAEEFMRLHHGPEPLVLPNPWDAGTARLLTQHGFRALATTSGGLAFALGVRDLGGAVSRQQVLDNIAAITGATSVPVTADLESGYGRRPEDVAETIRLAAEAGAVGGSIEDTTGDPDDPVRPLEEALERAEAAVAAARALAFPFTLTLRSDNFFVGRPDIEDTVKRLQAFEAVGADVVYAPGLREVTDLKRVLDAVSVPVNALALPVPGFSVRELGALGVRRVSVGSALSRVALAAVLEAATELRDHGTVGFVTSAPSYVELNGRMDGGPG